MARKRYRQQGTGSFFGEYLYERTFPSSHFLRQLDGLVKWEAFAEKLVQLYHGKAQVGAATVQLVRDTEDAAACLPV